MKYNERKFGVLLTYLNILLNTLVMLVYTPYILKYLGQSDYGLYALGLSILTYLALLDFGFGNAIVVFTSRYLLDNDKEKQQKLYSTIFITYLFICGVSIFCFYHIYLRSDDIFLGAMTESELEKFKDILIILAISIVVSIPGNIFKSIITAYERFIFLNIVSIVRSLMVPVATLLLIYLGFGVIDFVLIVAIINLIAILFHFCYYKSNINIKIKLNILDLQLLKHAVKYSFFVFIAVVVDQVNWNFGQLLIGSKLGTKDISVFSVAMLFNTTFIMLSSAISSVLLPKVTQMISSGVSDLKLTEEMTKIGRLQSYVILMVLFGFTIFGVDFIYFWAGENYGDAYLLTLIIMVPLSIPLVQNLGLSILKAKNKFRFRAISALIMSIVTITMSINMIEVYGYWGVALSISITFFVLNGIIMNLYYYHIGINIKYFWIEISKTLIPISIFSCCFYFIVNTFEILSFSGLILSILLFVCCFSLCVYFVCMNKYERNIVHNISKPVLNRFNWEKSKIKGNKS